MKSPSLYHNNLSIWIDVIRALAAQAVVLGHMRQILFINPNPDSNNQFSLFIQPFISIISSVPHEAVIVFFIISGYLVGGRVISDFLESRFCFSIFIQNRLSRLLIVLIPALLLTAVFDFFSFNYGDGVSILLSRQPFYPEWWAEMNPFGIQAFFTNATFLQMIVGFQFGTNLSLWSLSNEFWYYLLLPFLMGIIFYRGEKRLLFIVLTGFVLLLFIFSAKEHDPDRPIYYFYNLLIWMLGALAFFINNKPRLIIACLLFPLIALFIYSISNIPIIPSHLESLVKQDLVIAIGTVIMMRLFGFIPAKILKKSFAFLSSYSFSLYVLHLPLVFFAMSFNQQLGDGLSYNTIGLSYFLLLLFITNITAWLFSLLTERKTKQLRQALKRLFAK